MLELALELDTGKHTASTSDLILYVVRMTVRVEGYVADLVRRARLDGAGDYSRHCRGLAHRAEPIAVLTETLQVSGERLTCSF